MSVSTLILGESGTGKSASMRYLNPEETLLIQIVRKPLPFLSKGWSYFDKERGSGNIFVCDRFDLIIKAVSKTKKKIIVIDDFQYLMANEFMRRSDEKSYDKFTDIGKHAWEVITQVTNLPDDVRVYITAHTDTSDLGKVTIKTIGKLLADKICLEGLFSIVLRTRVIDRQFLFSTQNDGNDTVKSPMGLFSNELIDNDLAAVDAAICAYYGISSQPTQIKAAA